MKPIIFFLFLFALANNAPAQQQPPPPPADTLKHINDSDYDKEFITVQVEAQFPGGRNGWIAFLQNNLNPDAPRKNKAPKGSYTVIVAFLVDKQGNVSGTEILYDPGYGCAKEVLRIFKKCPAWIPATQNGKNVIYRQKQSITFVVE